jgi:hypothetical protein
MYRIFTLLLLTAFLLSGCKKSSSNLKWERTYGKGKAMFLAATPDSGIVACGEIENYPYFIKLNKDKEKIADYKYPKTGAYNSAWSDGLVSVATGYSDGKMLISCFSDSCKVLWDTTFTASFQVSFSTLCYLGNGNLIVMASGKMDSLYTSNTGLLTVWVNTNGTITGKTEHKESSYMSAGKIVTDNSGYIYLALTRKNLGSESKASVAKFPVALAAKPIWETELYNNPSFGASTTSLTMDISGNIFATGKTQLPVSGGQVITAFTVALSSGGTIKWKDYLEFSNSGIYIISDNNSHILTLHQNCFVIYSLDSGLGTTSQIVRPFEACESDNTTNLGWSLDLDYNNYLLMAGQNGGRFYLCAKTPIIYTQTNNLLQ